MSSSGPHSQRKPAHSHQGPSVRIVSDKPSLATDASFAGTYTTHSASSQNLYVWMVLLLLVASTTLALYDLYLLMSVVTAGN